MGILHRRECILISIARRDYKSGFYDLYTSVATKTNLYGSIWQIAVENPNFTVFQHYKISMVPHKTEMEDVRIRVISRMERLVPIPVLCNIIVDFDV